MQNDNLREGALLASGRFAESAQQFSRLQEEGEIAIEFIKEEDGQI
jgi:hypothetical protein